MLVTGEEVASAMPGPKAWARPISDFGDVAANSVSNGG